MTQQNEEIPQVLSNSYGEPEDVSAADSSAELVTVTD